MKILYLLLAFYLTIGAGKKQDDDYIKWKEDRKLTWDDFKAPPQKIGSTAALTTTHLGFSYSMTNGKVSYKIECGFQKSRSWGLVKNDWILKHEQGHFDIAEIFARKLYKQVSGYKFDKNTFQKDLDVIYKSVMDEKEKFQQQYDDETDYSRNKPKQEDWIKKIAGELTANKAWSGY